MKNKLRLTFVASIIALKLFAANGGPDTFGYIWKDSNEPGGPTYSWIDITTKPGVTEVPGLSDDNNTGPFAIGFNFQFYWYQVSQFWVGSNGYIAFNNGQISSPFPVIPSATQPNNFIGAFTADLNFDGATNPGACYYWQNTANDTLIVSYENAPFWSSSAATGFITGANSFQIILSKVDSSITFQYKVQNGTSAATTNFISIGIENNSGNVGLQHSTGVYPPVNYAIKYYYPANSTFQVSDAAVLWNDNEHTGAKFLLNNGPAFSLTTNVKNVGNQNLASFNVNSKVLNAANAVLINSTATANVPNPGDELFITQASSFAPTVNGTYRYTTDTQLASDATPSNNSKTMELVVIDTTSGLINLQYCDNSSEGTGLSWQAGNGGVGVYFEPPFSPYVIHRLEYFIISDPSSVGFTAKVNASDGIDHAPGTELVNISVPSASLTMGAWNSVPLTSPITLSDSGVYVSWNMNGDGILLGQDLTTPYSNRNFEILGTGWATYRFQEIEDVMIRMVVSTPTGALTNLKVSSNKLSNQLYPVPFKNQLFIELEESTIYVNIYNAAGQMISSTSTSNKNMLNIDTSEWPNGIYLVQMGSEKSQSTKRIVKE